MNRPINPELELAPTGARIARRLALATAAVWAFTAAVCWLQVRGLGVPETAMIAAERFEAGQPRG